MKYLDQRSVQKVLDRQTKKLKCMLWVEKVKLWVPLVILGLIACGYSVYWLMNFLMTFSLDGLEAFALSFIPLLGLWCILIVSAFLFWRYFKKKAEFLIAGLQKLIDSF